MNQRLFEYLKKSPTAFHAVATTKAELIENGFKELLEGEAWDLQEGGKYFVTRNQSSIIAFIIPTKSYEGYMICASHGDSPTFKVKENPELKENGYVKLNVEGYGGMLCAPWMDRPLSIAGRVVVKNGNTIESRLVDIDRDVLTIPNLAIHMDRNANKGYEYNIQKEMCPIIGSEDSAGALMKEIAMIANVKEEDIIGHDLFLYVREEGRVWGIQNEYISAGHLDDLQCSFANLQAILSCKPTNSIPVMAIFDNEEVGSMTKQGAFSTFMKDTLQRISLSLGKSVEEHRQVLSSSFLVSADNAHALHPSHSEKADPINRPKINNGIVIKYSGNQKYTTDAVSTAFFKEVCHRVDVPYQVYTNRSDIAGGSTLGNLSNVQVSMNAVDIGLPQLAMHSAYETAGAKDTQYLIDTLTEFFSLSFQFEKDGVYHIR